MALLAYPAVRTPRPGAAQGAPAAMYLGAALQPAVGAGQQDYRVVAATTGTLSDRVMYRATPTSPEAFGQLIASEITRWKPVIAGGRVKAD